MKFIGNALEEHIPMSDRKETITRLSAIKRIVKDGTKTGTLLPKQVCAAYTTWIEDAITLLEQQDDEMAKRCIICPKCGHKMGT